MRPDVKPRVYIAGKWEAQPRITRMSHAMRLRGWVVVNTWQDEPPSPYWGVSEDFQREAADRNCREVEMADVFIIDTFDEGTTGGREVEYGIALGRDIPLYVVGPVRNFFHRLAWARYDTWGDALEAFDRGTAPAARPAR